MKIKLLIIALAMALVSCSDNPSSEEGELRITEIMYNAGSVDSLEFIEIHNGTKSSISLENAVISGGVDFTFPAGTPDLAPGAYAVITNLPTEFTQKYPTIVAYGPWVGRLANSGDELFLHDSQGEKLLEAEYASEFPWPILANGGGYSLIDVGGSQTRYTSWATGALVNPGAKDEILSEFMVQINELMPPVEQAGWIELANLSSKAIDVSGWFVSDSVAPTNPYVIPAGTSIPANGFLVLNAADWQANIFPALSGGAIFLMETLNGKTTGRAHRLTYAAVASGVSVGYDAASSLQVGALAQATPGAENASYKNGSILISEIMYHPLDNGVEFVELINNSANTIELFPLLNPNKKWGMNGIDPNFPLGALMAPQAKVVLISENEIDTAVFRQRFSVPADVAIYTYSGKLSNSGERLTVQEPLLEIANIDGGFDYAKGTTDVVFYYDKAPWSVDADGLGKSLHRITLESIGSDPTSWEAKEPTPGK